ncbi:MAG: thermonuclease family protein [Lachnospiraceae bacterium]|nr:thermonuclease family protein [Lachnospiraceae bacterium]
MRKYKKTPYPDNIKIKPNRNNKYYLRSKCFFAAMAIFIVLFLSFKGVLDFKESTHSGICLAKVVRVIDGDTIVVNMNGKEHNIRMIGIDAPESVDPDEEENSVFGDIASAYTEEHLKTGTNIFLSFDKEKYDQYGRMLAYVWVCEDNDDINNLYQYQMVKDGYAWAIKIEPNTAFNNYLDEAMKDAGQNRRGLWGNDEFYKEYDFEL